jgi:hypothetical protein
MHSISVNNRAFCEAPCKVALSCSYCDGALDPSRADGSGLQPTGKRTKIRRNVMHPSLERVECTCSMMFGKAANRIPDYTVSKTGIHNMNLVRYQNHSSYKLRRVLVLVRHSKHYSRDSTDSTSVCEPENIQTVLLENNTVLQLFSKGCATKCCILCYCRYKKIYKQFCLKYILLTHT